jgi:hypothetical protein
MLNKLILTQLHDMHLPAMAKKYAELCDNIDTNNLTFDELFGIIVETQWMHRETNRITRLVHDAHFRLPASAENIDYNARHGITKNDSSHIANKRKSDKLF